MGDQPDYHCGNSRYLRFRYFERFVLKRRVYAYADRYEDRELQTGAYEATYIASEILSGFAALRCRGIFSTHLHDLAAGVADINARSAENGGIRIDTLVAGIEEGRRSFKIYRAKPDGKSYAKDIADKYGLSFEGLMKRARESAK